MTNHTDDDKFDAWVQGAARDYNRPTGPAARDDMWVAIEGALDAAQQDAAHDRPAASPVSPDVAPIVASPSPRPSQRRRLAPVWWQAAAAALLVAAGIGIGRTWSGGDTPGVTASGGAATNAAGGERALSGGDSALAPSLAGLETASPDSARGTDAGAPLGAGAPSARDLASGGTAALVDGARGRSYDVASMQHLSRAEALLTAFRSGDGAAAGGSTSMDRWARDLLADTRLFIDSPAASDARRRQLLLDLELVLAQIVQLPAESSADRGLVQRSIERGAVLSRLRSTIPAGYSSGT